MGGRLKCDVDMVTADLVLQMMMDHREGGREGGKDSGIFIFT